MYRTGQIFGNPVPSEIFTGTLKRCGFLTGIGFLLIHQAMAEVPLKLVTMEYPPYTYEESGRVQGFVTDLLREAFRRMAIPISLETVPWARGIAEIKKGTVDGIFTIYHKPEREEFADFSEETLATESVSLFVLKDSPITFDGDLLKLLRRYTFGTVRGYSYGTVFDEARKQEGVERPTEAATTEQNVEKLLKQRYPIMISDKYTALDSLSRLGQTDKVKELTPPVQEVPAFVAFSRASKYPDLPEIRKRFDTTLRQMKVDGTYDQIIDSFFKTR